MVTLLLSSEYMKLYDVDMTLEIKIKIKVIGGFGGS